MNECTHDCICWECMKKHHNNGCSYGQPDGPDDIIKDCDCEEDYVSYFNPRSR